MVYPSSIHVPIFSEQQLGADLAERLHVSTAPSGILVVQLVQLVRARNLRPNDLLCEPYVSFRMGQQAYRARSPFPEFKFNVWHRSLEVLFVSVHDEDLLMSSDDLGSCEIDL